jgi:hypothetical protein
MRDADGTGQAMSRQAKARPGQLTRKLRALEIEAARLRDENEALLRGGEEARALKRDRELGLTICAKCGIKTTMAGECSRCRLQAMEKERDSLNDDVLEFRAALRIAVRHLVEHDKEYHHLTPPDVMEHLDALSRGGEGRFPSPAACLDFAGEHARRAKELEKERNLLLEENELLREVMLEVVGATGPPVTIGGHAARVITCKAHDMLVAVLEEAEDIDDEVAS